MYKKLLFTILLASFMFPGCAYFNTFYLAKKNFSDAEVLRKREKGKVIGTPQQKYNLSIDYSLEVIEKFKKSKYVDDSLYFLGMSYYHLGKTLEARIKFDEILMAFPDSKYAPDALYYKAKSLVDLDNIEEARKIFLQILNSDDRKIKALAGFELCELDIQDEDWLELKEISEKIIEFKPEKNDLFTAKYYLGRSEFETENYKACIEILSKLDKEKLPTDLKFRVNSLMASAYAELGTYDTAMNYLTSIGSKGKFEAYSRQIRLEIGHLYEIKGDDPMAMDEYNKLAGDYPDSLEGKQAWYRSGLIILKDLSNAKEAKENFTKIKEDQKIKTEPWFVDAQIKKVQIDQMDSILSKINKISGKESNVQQVSSNDSLTNAETAKPKENKIDFQALVSLRFSLAEIYTYSFDRPDSALSQYRCILEELPGSEYAVKSEYFLSLSELKDTKEYSAEVEKELMKKIIEKYPASQFTQELRVMLGEQSNTPAEKDFIEAENARVSGVKSEEYIPLFLSIAEKYPGTPSGYKALFSAAYFYEHDAGDKQKAYEILEKLAGEKSNSVNMNYVKLAQEKMELVKNEPELLKQINQNIAAFEFEIGSEGNSQVSAEATETIAPPKISGENYSGLRKIRARNARIRSRYYQN